MTKVAVVHPQGTIDIYTQFHGPQCSSFVDIVVNAKSVDLSVELEEQSGNHKGHFGSPSGEHE